MSLQEGNEFIDAEIREDLPMPVERGCFRLAGESDHFLHGLPVTGNDKGLHLDFFACEVFDNFVAPGATAFDVEDG